MKQDRPVRSVELTALVHATEDDSKVRRAILNLFPPGAEPPAFEATALTGYFGDPITTLKVVVRNRRPAAELLANIVRRLSPLDQVTLVDELPLRMDETKNLYVRLDKQRALRGQVALDRRDAIRVKAKLQVPHGLDPVEAARRCLEDAAGGEP
jgi:RNA binding exosome subunit